MPLRARGLDLATRGRSSRGSRGSSGRLAGTGTRPSPLPERGAGSESLFAGTLIGPRPAGHSGSPCRFSKPLRGSQASGARAWVPRDLILGGSHWLLCEDREPLVVTQGPLHDPVLQRVVC